LKLDADGSSSADLLALFFSLPNTHDIHVIVQLHPKRCVRHPQLQRDEACRNIAGRAAVREPDAWVEDNPDFIWDQRGEYNRRDAI
jgi:hypothetical protein